MSIRVRAAIGAALFSLTFAGCSTTAGGDVASINGQKISRASFDDKLEVSQQAKSVFTQMVQGILIDQYAKDNKIDVSDAEVNAKIDDYRSRYPAGQFDQILKAQNLTMDDVKRLIRQQLIVQKAIAPKVTVTNAEIAAYLAKNHATLDTGAQVQARHILVPDIGTANKVEAALKGGAKFADVAKQYSTDPSTKDKGGELGFFPKGQMVPAFQNAAFSQPIGVVGPPVKSPFGYHIIEVEARKPAQIATIANSGDKIKTIIQQQQDQTLIPQFLSDLRAKANIQIFDANLQDALPPAAAAPPAGAAGAAGAGAAGASPAAAASPSGH